MALAQRLIDPPGQHPEEPIGEPATPVSQADAVTIHESASRSGMPNRGRRLPEIPARTAYRRRR
jgi:hypothetical protein